MIKSDWAGLDKLQKKAEKLDGEHDIPLDKLFNPSFMKRYTKHTTIDEFLESGGFEFETEEEFENLSEEQLDQHVRISTNFNSWRDMLAKAGDHWLAKELGF